MIRGVKWEKKDVGRSPLFSADEDDDCVKKLIEVTSRDGEKRNSFFPSLTSCYITSQTSDWIKVI